VIRSDAVTCVERLIHHNQYGTFKQIKGDLMKLRTLVLQVVTLCFVLGTFGFAADNAYLYVVHGVPGRDIADNLNPDLPIDILIDGDCLARGLAFGNTSGPLSFSAGTYNIQISNANTLAPCTNAPMIVSPVTLTAGTSVSAVAAISGGQTTLVTFNDNLSQIGPGHARFSFAQVADAPALQATLTQLNVKNPKTFTLNAAPDLQASAIVPAGTYRVQVTAAGSTTVLTSEQIVLPDQAATFSYATGQAVNNTLGLVNRTVRGVF
jgi:hypothetical protein